MARAAILTEAQEGQWPGRPFLQRHRRDSGQGGHSYRGTGGTVVRAAILTEAQEGQWPGQPFLQRHRKDSGQGGYS